MTNMYYVIRLSTYVAKNKDIRVYSKHGSTNLTTYLMSSTKVVIKEIEETPSPKLHTYSKRRSSILTLISQIQDYYCWLSLT